MKRAALIVLIVLAAYIGLAVLHRVLPQPSVDQNVRDCIGRPHYDHDGFHCDPVTP